MKKNENNIDKLLILEQEYRNKENYSECLEICLKILEEIKSLSEKKKFDIISKLFLFENQSNYVRIHLMYELFQNNNFIDSLSVKRKYYKLLIDSLVSDSFFHDAYGNTMKKSLVFTQNDLDMSFLAQIKNGINLNFGELLIDRLL